MRQFLVNDDDNDDHDDHDDDDNDDRRCLYIDGMQFLKKTMNLVGVCPCTRRT